MIIKKYSKVLLPILAILWVGDSFALGLGLTSGSADEDWTNNYSFPSSASKFEVSNFGFVLDSNVAKDKLFNYRFSLTKEENKSKNGSLKLEGITMTHDFGFALFKNEFVRLWLGPRLNTALYDTVKDNGVDTGGEVVGISWGPVLGVNLHLKDVVSFSITTGMQRGRYVGDYISNSSSSKYDIDADINSRFLNLSVIFRMRDSY